MKRSWWKRGEGILSINLRLLDKLKQSGGGGFPSLIFSVGGFLWGGVIIPPTPPTPPALKNSFPPPSDPPLISIIYLSKGCPKKNVYKLKLCPVNPLILAKILNSLVPFFSYVVNKQQISHLSHFNYN